jgi:hypothetical protein
MPLIATPGIVLKPHGGGQDDAPQIQAAMDTFVDPDQRWPNTSGGTIWLDRGTYTIKQSLRPKCGGIQVIGQGNPSTLSCLLNWRGPPDEAMWVLHSPNTTKYARVAGFRLADIAMRSRGEAGTAVRFDVDYYDREFCFDRVAIEYFERAFHVHKGEVSTGGAVFCNQCRFTYNGQVLDAMSSGALNESRFRDCLLSKNGLTSGRYAFAIRGGSSIHFDGSVLEGQPRVIHARNIQNLILSGCRFECNVGDNSTNPVMLVEKSAGVWIDRCFHRIVKAEEASPAATLHLRSCRDYDYSTSRLRRIVVEDDDGHRVVTENLWRPVW